MHENQKNIYMQKYNKFVNETLLTVKMNKHGILQHTATCTWQKLQYKIASKYDIEVSLNLL